MSLGTWHLLDAMGRDPDWGGCLHGDQVREYSSFYIFLAWSLFNRGFSVRMVSIPLI